MCIVSGHKVYHTCKRSMLCVNVLFNLSMIAHYQIIPIPPVSLSKLQCIHISIGLLLKHFFLVWTPLSPIETDDGSVAYNSSLIIEVFCIVFRGDRLIGNSIFYYFFPNYILLSGLGR